MTGLEEKPIPGFIFFKCYSCGFERKVVMSDCYSISSVPCIGCRSLVTPLSVEEHKEWKVSKDGDLLENFDYELNEPITSW
jgi:hypothetical protein